MTDSTGLSYSTPEEESAAIQRKYLTRAELLIVNYIEQYWMRHGDFPPDATVNKFIQREGIKKNGFDAAVGPSILDSDKPDYSIDLALKEPLFLQALARRGIRRFKNSDYSKESVDLSPSQVSAIALILDHSDRRSRKAKLQSLGINSQTWNGWMRDNAFKTYFHDLASRVFHDAIDSVQEGIVKAAESGDMRAAQFYYEITGRAQNNQLENNLHMILTRLIESIQRHVKDSETVKAIAADFNLIMAGEKVIEDTRQIEGGL